MSRIESIGLTRSQGRPATLNEARMAVDNRQARRPQWLAAYGEFTLKRPFSDGELPRQAGPRRRRGRIIGRNER
jgi:hypothetical protein